MQDIEVTWLDRAREGDSLAFASIVDRYQRPVYNLCYRMLGHTEDAEDAAQETFLRAYKAIKRYDKNRSFSSWLLAIAAHYCIDQHRRRKLSTVSVEELPVPDLPDKQPGLEMRVSKKEEMLHIRGLLEALDPTDRAAVILYYWYDYSYEEICETLSLSNSAIKSRLHRARKAMAQRWLEQQGNPLNVERMPA